MARIRLSSEGDARILQHYDWPGNVRELQNVIERAVIVPLAAIDDRPPGGGGKTCPSPSAGGASQAGILREAALANETERRLQERAMIESALAACDGKVFGPGGAADRLGLRPTTLASRIKRLGIEKPRRDGGA